MLRQLRAALVVLLAMTLLTGVAYPLLVTAVAQAAFRDKANGSLLVRGGSVKGSALIGQPFDDPRYFWGRPSTTSPMPYNGGASSGSNLGPTNKALLDAIKARVEALRTADPGNTSAIPADLATASASGLDPHITPAAALYQIARVARTRGVDEARLRELVAKYTKPRLFSVLGEPHVNVLLLNMALDDVR
jgi:potassium-transporting ATPase KdpC subunit